MTFNTWLSKQYERNDAVGDLAQDVRQDTGWPQSGSINRKRERLAQMNACDGANEALEHAWQEFKQGRAKGVS